MGIRRAGVACWEKAVVLLLKWVPGREAIPVPWRCVELCTMPMAPSPRPRNFTPVRACVQRDGLYDRVAASLSLPRDRLKLVCGGQSLQNEHHVAQLNDGGTCVVVLRSVRRDGKGKGRHGMEQWWVAEVNACCCGFHGVLAQPCHDPWWKCPSWFLSLPSGSIAFRARRCSAGCGGAQSAVCAGAASRWCGRRCGGRRSAAVRGVMTVAGWRLEKGGRRGRSWGGWLRVRGKGGSAAGCALDAGSEASVCPSGASRPAPPTCRFRLAANAPAWQRAALRRARRAGVPDAVLTLVFGVVGWKFWVGLVAWMVGARTAARTECGPIYMLATVFALMLGKLGRRIEGQASAYSIFNGLRRLPGQLTAEQLDDQLRHGNM